MATRPIFIPNTENERRLVDEIDTPFHWNPGIARCQKMKNVTALHKSAESKYIRPLLEISTKSESSLGRSLSAFNLWISIPAFGRAKIEAAFQGSKVFENGGPYTDFYREEDGSKIKKDDRLKSSGELKYFFYDHSRWELFPQTAFYDWLYINALQKNNIVGLFEYGGFTDIEFNPKKSINCQARSVALYVSLLKRNLVNKGEYIDRERFLEVLSKWIVRPSSNQRTLF
jgi:hypothetical protein